MSFDVAKARPRPSGCEGVVHLNNAGASLMPDVVLQTVIEHLELEARIGGYEAAARENDRVEATYDSVARLLGCSRDEVAIVENATRAWDMAFYSFDFQPGDRILTCGAEYASNYIALLQVAKRTGAEVVVVGDDESGQVSLSALEQELERGARLVSLVHVPSQGGLIQPAAGVGRLCRAAGVPLLLDACQSVGQLPTDVRELECDILSATGRKFLRGPRGTGFLYVRQGLIEQLEPPFLDLHAAEWDDRDTFSIRADARRFENWETSYATKLGLGAAVDYALGWGLEAIASRVQGLGGVAAGAAVCCVRASRCAIAARRSARSSRSRSRASRRTRSRSASTAAGVNVSVTPEHLQPPRPRRARPRRRRAGVGALLQHRGGAGAAGRGCRGWVTPS